jgi:hypothetical protein
MVSCGVMVGLIVCHRASSKEMIRDLVRVASSPPAEAMLAS